MTKADALQRIALGKGYDKETDAATLAEVKAQGDEGDIPGELAYRVLQVEQGFRRPSIPSYELLWG